MIRRSFQLIGVLFAAGFVYLMVDYSRDPAYWQRWWDLLTNLEPDHMNFRPTVVIESDAPIDLPHADKGGQTIGKAALDEAQAFAAAMDSFAFIVVHRGKVQREWYGPGWDRQRLTQSQSMMKTLTALMVGIAIADGAIESVDDPLARYLAEWRNDPRGQISIAQLLQMSSGLARFRFTLNPFALDSSFRFLNTGDRAAAVLAIPMDWKPGSRFDYNDVNAQLAGLLVERATGRPYAEYFQERLWQPLGGRHAELWLDRDGGLAMTACCLLAAALDWAKVGLLLKDEGRWNGRQIVSAEWLADLLEPTMEYAGYGYFTWLARGLDEAGPPMESPGLRSTEAYLAEDLFILQGYGGQRVYVSREYDLVVVRLGPFAGMAPLAEGWDNSRLINTLIRGIHG